MTTWTLRLMEAACPSLHPSLDKVLAACLSLCPKCPSKKPVTVSGAGAFLHHGLVFLNDICSDLVSKQGHILKCWGLGLQCRNGGGGGGCVQPTAVTKFCLSFMSECHWPFEQQLSWRDCCSPQTPSLLHFQ